MAITIMQPNDIEKMRAANKIVAQTLDYVESVIKPGISLLEIDKICDDMIRAAGAKPAFKGLYGFPNAACISVNEVVIHGIPNEYKLQEGDIVSVDIGSNLNGYFGDSARTWGVGQISREDEKLIACAKDALYFAIDTVKAGMHFKELSFENIIDLVKEYLSNEDYSAFGIMFFDRDNLSMKPYVYVKEVGSGVYENSCASGTTALGYYLKKYKNLDRAKIVQPNGWLEYIIENDEIYIDGPVEIVAEGKVYVCFL